jgi:hypothetical protein
MDSRSQYFWPEKKLVRIHGLAIKFSHWCEKRNKKYKDFKNCFISIQSNFCLLEYIFATFKRFLKTVSKALQRNSVQYSHHVFLNVLNILKPLSFEGSFHCRKEKKSAGARSGE